MRLRWTQRAKGDLLEIGRFIAADDPTAAGVLVNRLRQRAKKALRFPRAGRMVPELQRDDIRELIDGNYRIVYRISKGFLDVLTVFEGHHLLGDI